MLFDSPFILHSPFLVSAQCDAIERTKRRVGANKKKNKNRGKIERTYQQKEWMRKREKKNPVQE